MSGIGNTNPKAHGLRWALGTLYQFSTTTKSPIRVDNNSIIYYFGSAAKIMPISEPEPGMPIDGKLKVKPTGSTMQRPPEGNLNAWKFTYNPANNCGDTVIANVYNTILQFKDSFVKAGSVPDQSFRVKAIYEVDEQGEPTDILDRYRIVNNLRYRRINGDKIAFLGAKMPMRPTNTTLLVEQVKQVRGRCLSFPLAIETDFIQQGWTIEVESQEFGNRTFMILSAMDGKFHIFPISASNSGTIAEKYIRTVTPIYPDWVCPFVNVKQLSESRNGKSPLNPIYSWSVNESGNLAIACLVERKQFTNNLLNQVLTANGAYPEYLSEQEDLGTAKVFAEKSFFGDGNSEPLMIDRLGVVGLQFNIRINSPELESFSCDVTVFRNTPPVDTSPIRVGIAYAKPVLESPIEADSVIELFMQFYESDDQLKFHRALDGIYGGEAPQYAKWLIKVNGNDYLSFPMQAILDQDNAPIPFGCLKHMIEATTIYTELENLDLSTLSFYRTVRVRKPKLTRNVEQTTDTAWIGKMNHLTKQCAIQTDAFVNGQIVDMRRAGNTTLFSLITTYLTFSFDQNMRATLNEWSPTLKYPLRANYRSFFTNPSNFSSFSFLEQGRVGPQWWAHVLFWPMWYVFVEMVHKELAGSASFGPYHNLTYEQLRQLNPIPDMHEGCHHNCTSAYPPISEVNRGNFEQSYWNSVMNFDYEDTDISSTFTLVTFILNCFKEHEYGKWPIQSMLQAANPQWNGDSTMLSWLAKEIFMLAKDIFPSSFYADSYEVTVLNPINNSHFDSVFYNFSNYEYILGLCCAYYHAADAQWTNSMDAFWMLDPGRPHWIKDHFVLRDYPWCWHFAIQNYNRFLVNRGRNAIMVHPNGHYSLMHDYLYCPTDEEPEAELWAYTLSSNAFNSPDNPISDYRTGFENTTPPSISPRDGFMMDQLAFWNRTIQTSHVAMHNEAFDRTETLSEYYPNSERLYDYFTDKVEPVIVYGGQRFPSHYFNNPFMRFAMSEEANELNKDLGVALAYPRVAPLWGK